MDVIELLNELAELQESDLKAKKRDELRTILNSLKQKDSARVNKLKKAELIAEILEAVAEYKETLNKAEAFDRMVPDLSATELETIDQYVTKVDLEDDNDIGALAGDVFKQFIAECQKLYDQERNVWGMYSAGLSDLAYQTASRLESRGNASTTLLNYRTDLLNHLERMLEGNRDKAWFEPCWQYLTGHSYSDRHRKSRGKGDDCLDCFAKSLYKIWQFSHSQTKRDTEKAGRETKETTYKQIDITGLLQWANGVLTELELTSTNRKQWKDVSVALAVATGRRQVEIHCTGVFTYVDEYHVEFSGQAKARGKAKEAYETNPSYIIPTLVKADLVVKGYKWLKVMSGKHYPTEKQVNDNVNRDVNSYLKTIAKELVKGYDEGGSQIPDETLGGTFTYHDLREVYAQASYVCEGCKKYKRGVVHRWVNEVLGEDRGGVGAISTAMRYLDEYELTSDSLTRI